MRMEDLKKTYDVKGIDEIELIAKDSKASHESQHKQFIGVLFYLENTKRFKENKTYKDASFAAYVMGVFGIPFTTYDKYRFAYFRYGVESEEFGAGNVMKIVSNCGREMVPVVAKELRQQKNKLNPERIRETIEKFAKKRLKQRKARPSYKDLDRELIAEKKKNGELNRALKLAHEQIERLKATVRSYETAFTSVSQLLPPAVVEDRSGLRA